MYVCLFRDAMSINDCLCDSLDICMKSFLYMHHKYISGPGNTGCIILVINKCPYLSCVCVRNS